MRSMGSRSFSRGGYALRSALKLIKRLARDEDGAPLVEYTVLLGILVVAVIALIIAVGSWVNNKWSVLNSQLT